MADLTKSGVAETLLQMSLREKIAAIITLGWPLPERMIFGHQWSTSVTDSDAATPRYSLRAFPHNTRS